jgi:hypothetical protein
MQALILQWHFGLDVRLRLTIWGPSVLACFARAYLARDAHLPTHSYRRPDRSTSLTTSQINPSNVTILLVIVTTPCLASVRRLLTTGAR